MIGAISWGSWERGSERLMKVRTEAAYWGYFLHFKHIGAQTVSLKDVQGPLWANPLCRIVLGVFFAGLK